MGVLGSPVLTVAAGAAVRGPPSNSRREKAAAVHISGAAAGALPLPAVVNHDNRSAPTASTEPLRAAAGAVAVITGADAGGGVASREPEAASCGGLNSTGGALS
ncbi:hypothetical protein [Mycolicibacterium sp.]|uniref:hypothetical protein n=1 Tax=Mycolicibacterium sp. TaxID=2320850 RepID=UPI0028A7EE55|nr:hypothetical protein [Mycolicibacterium sp.]